MTQQQTEWWRLQTRQQTVTLHTTHAHDFNRLGMGYVLSAVVGMELSSYPCIQQWRYGADITDTERFCDDS